MKLDIDKDHKTVIVTLSRRNLLALLAKLDRDGSARTIATCDCSEDDRPVEDMRLIVCAEDDDEHYGDRPPGPMHPDTERSIRELRDEVVEPDPPW